MSKKKAKQDIPILKGFHYGYNVSYFHRILKEFIIDGASVILGKKWCWPKTTSKLSNQDYLLALLNNR